MGGHHRCRCPCIASFDIYRARPACCAAQRERVGGARRLWRRAEPADQPAGDHVWAGPHAAHKGWVCWGALGGRGWAGRAGGCNMWGPLYALLLGCRWYLLLPGACAGLAGAWLPLQVGRARVPLKRHCLRTSAAPRHRCPGTLVPKPGAPTKEWGVHVSMSSPPSPPTHLDTPRPCRDHSTNSHIVVSSTSAPHPLFRRPQA